MDATKNPNEAAETELNANDLEKANGGLYQDKKLRRQQIKRWQQHWEKEAAETELNADELEKANGGLTVDKDARKRLKKLSEKAKQEQKEEQNQE